MKNIKKFREMISSPTKKIKKSSDKILVRNKKRQKKVKKTKIKLITPLPLSHNVILNTRY